MMDKEAYQLISDSTNNYYSFKYEAKPSFCINQIPKLENLYQSSQIVPSIDKLMSGLNKKAE